MPPFKSKVARKDEILVTSRSQWRKWLESNHKSRKSIWLVFYKKAAISRGRCSIDYQSAVLEALCFGWIDSKVQRIDSEKYRQYFCARKPTGYWNGANKRRIEQLEEEGLMTEAGHEAIATAKANGAWEFLNDIEAMLIPDDLAAAFSSEGRSRFDEFSKSKKQGILCWIKQAKRATTRVDRINKTAQAASRGETPLSYL